MFTLSKINCGRYVSDIVGEPSAQVAEFLIQAGFKKVIQNGVFPAWTKAQAVRRGLWPIDPKTKRPVRPTKENCKSLGLEKEFVLKDIPYDAEGAKAMEILLGTAKISIEVPKLDGEGNLILDGDGEPVVETKEFDLGVTDVLNLGEYTGAESAVPAYRDQKRFIQTYLAANGGKLTSGEPRSIESFCVNRGLDLPETPWESDLEFLGRVKEWQLEIAEDE